MAKFSLLFLSFFFLFASPAFAITGYINPDEYFTIDDHFALYADGYFAVFNNSLDPACWADYGGNWGGGEVIGDGDEFGDFGDAFSSCFGTLESTEEYTIVWWELGDNDADFTTYCASGEEANIVACMEYADYSHQQSFYWVVEPLEPILGCTDPEAENYDPSATEDDDSCTYPTPWNPLPMIPTPTKYATTTCENFGTTTLCITEYQPEITYQDWLQVSLWTIFLLAILALGFFFSTTLRKRS